MSRTQIEADIDPTTLRPLRDQVLVEEIAQKNVGVIEVVQQKGRVSCVNVGKVIAVGSGIHEESSGKVFPMEIFEGDVVVFMDYAGERMELSGKKYRMIREHGIWGKTSINDENPFEFDCFEPRFNTMVIRLRDETKTENGKLFLPGRGNADCQYRKADVVKVGPGVWYAPTGERLPVEFGSGDEIIFQRYAGADVTIAGEVLRLIQENDVIVGI